MGNNEVKIYGYKEYCNFCTAIASYDGKTIFGPWAYMCDGHFHLYGTGLGLGKGQEITYVPEDEN